MPQNKKYRILLFDVDDTLLDFPSAERLSFFETMESFEIKANEKMHEDYSVINRSCWELMQKGVITKDELLVRRFRLFADLYKIDVSPSLINDHFLKKLGEKAILFPDTFEVCERLAATYEMYMITNSVASVHHNRMEKCPIKPFFKGSFISEEVGFPKPGIKFFEAVADRIEGFDKGASLVIGDSPTSDLEGANTFGIDCCYVDRYQRELPLNIRADYTVSSLTELCGILQ